MITEALKGGSRQAFAKYTIHTAPADNGARTILKYQEVGGRRYFDAAGICRAGWWG